MDKEVLKIKTEDNIEQLRVSEQNCVDLLNDIRQLEEKNTEIELDVLREITEDSTYTNQTKRDVAKAQRLRNDLQYLDNKTKIQNKQYELEKEQVNISYLKRIIQLNTAYLQHV